MLTIWTEMFYSIIYSPKLYYYSPELLSSIYFYLLLFVCTSEITKLANLTNSKLFQQELIRICKNQCTAYIEQSALPPILQFIFKNKLYMWYLISQFVLILKSIHFLYFFHNSLFTHTHLNNEKQSQYRYNTQIQMKGV